MKQSLLTVIFAFFLVVPAWSGELHVGQKVVYPGGADQPPKEKDIGLKLKVDNITVSEATTPELPDDQEVDDLTALLDTGRFQDVIHAGAGKKDPISRALVALAIMEEEGRLAEGLQAAQAVASDPRLTDDLRDRLTEKIQEAREQLSDE